MSRITERTMMERAARAVGKIDLHGARGITLCSAQEIEAMALTLAAMGLVPVHPGASMPERLIVVEVLA